ncbi:MAG TPA: tyrosinase family protein [Streptosporangiaceae bacterium]
MRLEVEGPAGKSAVAALSLATVRGREAGLANHQMDTAQSAVVPGVRLRKSVATLTGADLAGLRAALVAMQGISDDRGYQHYAGIHGLPLPGYCVHHDAAGILGNLPAGPLFLPWHRAYLYFFELALQDAGQDATVALPWWDWTTDPAQPSEILAAYAMETASGQPNPLYQGPIVAIPDSQWEGERRTLTDDTGIDPGPLPAVTFRQPGALPAAPPGLPTPPEVKKALSSPSFVDFSQRIERIHDAVHVWVGGTMSEIPVAAYDPLFYAHHTMIDRLWWLWQLQHPGAGPPARYLNVPLPPFPSLTVGGTLDINGLGYEYALAEVPFVPAAQG